MEQTNFWLFVELPAVKISSHTSLGWAVNMAFLLRTGGIPLTERLHDRLPWGWESGAIPKTPGRSKSPRRPCLRKLKLWRDIPPMEFRQAVHSASGACCSITLARLLGEGCTPLRKCFSWHRLPEGLMFQLRTDSSSTPKLLHPLNPRSEHLPKPLCPSHPTFIQSPSPANAQS